MPFLLSLEYFALISTREMSCQHQSIYASKLSIIHANMKSIGASPSFLLNNIQ